MSIFANEQVSVAFNELRALAGNSTAIAAIFREDLGDKGFAGSRDTDTANIADAITKLKEAFLAASSDITYDDISYASEQVTRLVAFGGSQGGETVAKDWDKYLIALEAMVEARPDLKPRCVLRAELAEVAGLQGATVRVPSATFIHSGVDRDDPRPAAVRDMLARLDATAA